MRLKDKVAVVTGGAGAIGGEITRLLAREGSRIVIADVNTEDSGKLVAEVKALGSEALAVNADVIEIDQAGKVVEEALARFNQIDILVNVAGGSTGTVHQNEDGFLRPVGKNPWRGNPASQPPRTAELCPGRHQSHDGKAPRRHCQHLFHGRGNRYDERR